MERSGFGSETRFARSSSEAQGLATAKVAATYTRASASGALPEALVG
jgi:hypothetical protein